MCISSIATRRWDRAEIDGVELEFTILGAGEPVVLMHAGVCAEFFLPLAAQPILAERYRLLLYHRVGYAGSSRLAGPVSIAQQAAYCHSLMRRLGIASAHVVGHSSSAMMALQMALDAPEAVHSLALLDAARPAPPSPVQQAFLDEFVRPAMRRYQAGDKTGAVDLWLQGTCGADYRVALDRVIPEAATQAVADADTFFGQELPAVQEWSFTAEDASRITQPVLAVLGAKSRPIFRERHELLLAWLPNVAPFTLPQATHLLHVENPQAMAEALVDFFARHPLATT